jgi:hypothetical protein
MTVRFQKSPGKTVTPDCEGFFVDERRRERWPNRHIRLAIGDEIQYFAEILFGYRHRDDLS